MSELYGLSQKIYCKVFLSNTLHIGYFGSSGYNLVALSIERYMAIVYPLHYDESQVKIVFIVFDGIVLDIGINGHTFIYSFIQSLIHVSFIFLNCQETRGILDYKAWSV